MIIIIKQKNYKLILLFSLFMLLISTACSPENNKYVVNVQQVTTGIEQHLVWRNNDEIVGKFHVNEQDINLNDIALYILNIKSGDRKLINKYGGSPSISKDGSKLGYFIGPYGTPKDIKQGFYLFDLTSDKESRILVGSVFGFDDPMSPAADKFVFYEGKNQPVKIFPQNHTMLKIFKWPYKENYYLNGKWTSDGNSLLILEDPVSSTATDLAFYTPEGQRKSEIPKGDYITRITDFKMNLEGNKIYAITVHDDHRLAGKGLFRGNNIDVFDLKKPEEGWKTVVSHPGPIFNWDIGTDDLIIFNHQPNLEKMNGGLWIYKLGMKEAEQVTSGPDDYPVISPNGKMVAFIRETGDLKTPVKEKVMILQLKNR